MTDRRSIPPPRLAAVFVLLLALSVTASIAASQVALGLCVLSALTLVTAGRGRLARTGLEGPVAAFVIWCVATIPLSSDPGQSMVFARRFWLYAALWVAATWPGGGRGRLLAAYVVGAALLFVYTITDHVIDRSSLRMAAAHGPMTGGGLAMLAFLATLPFVISSRLRPKVRLALLAALLIFVAALLLTVTRSAILGCAVGVLLLLLLTRSRILVATTATAVLVVVVLALTTDLGEAIAIRFDPSYLREGSSTTVRTNVWGTGLQIIRAEPWTGLGDCDMHDELAANAPEGQKIVFGHLHNNMLQIGANWGVPGLVLSAVLFVAIYRRLLARRREARGDPDDPYGEAWALAALAAWTGFHVAGIFEWYFGDAEMMLTLWVLTGAALAPRDRAVLPHSA